MKPSTEADFWAGVEQDGGPDSCWPWTRRIHTKGYGHVKWQGRLWFAHRLAYALRVSDPGRMCVCHRCDNRPCCNPTHLFIGSNDDNMADMKRKGRQARGERIHTAKIVSCDAVEIVRLSTSGTKTSDIAAVYGLSAGSVRAVVAGRKWSHATGVTR